MTRGDGGGMMLGADKPGAIRMPLFPGGSYLLTEHDVVCSLSAGGNVVLIEGCYDGTTTVDQKGRQWLTLLPREKTL